LSRLSELNKIEQKRKQNETYYINYDKGIHKKFYRPSQIEYWINKGLSIKNAKQSMFEYYSNIGKEYHNKRREKGIEFLTVRQFKYWEKTGLSDVDAREQLRLIQDTRSLKSYIERYGKKEGTKKYNIVITKWLETMNNKSNEEKLDILIRKTTRSKKYSKASIDLFNAVLDELENQYNIIFKYVYMGEKEYYIYDYDKKKLNFYDLFLKDINLVIEYHGIMFHPNEKILNGKEWKNWYNIISGNSADKQHNIDVYKKELVESKDLHYIEVWENESFDKNKHIIINKILNIYDKANYD